MDKNTAIVADIQRASLHDGPGIRTTVFFKGCPLNCMWCHNPECIDKEPQTLFYPEKCIGCGLCEKGCYSGARVVCGKEMTAEEIFSEIMLDKASYGCDGGVTFSGGEPLLYPEILAELIDLCKKEGIHTAIETSLFIYNPEILGSVDLVMADFKLWDREKHLKYTGVYNDKIKPHFIMLNFLGVPFIVRTPIIPEVNDTPEEIKAIRDFIKDFKNLMGYELLPYHPLGEGKREALGLKTNEFKIPDRAKMEELKKYADL